MSRRYFDIQNVALIFSGLIVPQAELKPWLITVSIAVSADILEMIRDKIGA